MIALTEPVVRRIAESDEDALVNLLAIDHAESGFMPWDEQKVRQMVKAGIDNDGIAIGVIGAPNNLEAAIGLILAEWYYSQMPHLQSIFDFVHPAHRETGHATRLMKFANLAAERLAIPLFMGVPERDASTVAKIKVYSKRLAPAGILFWHQPNVEGARLPKSVREARTQNLVNAFSSAA